MENKNTALVKSNTALARVSNQIAITNRLLEVADPFLIPYRKGDKWGFCDWDKRIVIECVYDEVYIFSEKRAAVSKNGKWGFIDKWGHLTIQTIFKSVQSFSEGLACVNLNGKWGYINEMGNENIPFIYGTARSFSSGRAWVSSSPEFDGHEPGCALINRMGDMIYPVKMEHELIDGPIIGDFKDGMALIGSFNPSRWEEDDEKSSLFLYQYLSFDCDEFWGPDEGGFEEAYDFQDGLACVKHRGKYGFLDIDFHEIIKFNYDMARPFGQGRAPVKQNGEWSYINKNEDKLFSLSYDQCYEFCDGLARVNTMEEDIFDPPVGTGILYYGRPRIRIIKKYGFINTAGELILPCNYDDAENFSDGLAKVKKENIYFYIDTNGNEYYEK